MQNWVRLQILENLIQGEIFLLIIVLSFSAWTFYKLFLKRLSEDRHKNLQIRFNALFRHVFLFAVFYFSFVSLLAGQESLVIARLLPYLGLLTIIWGSIVFIQACRIVVLQYLFLTSMRAGVPVLLVNIFSLALSLFIAGWIAASLFGVQLAPLLATSAAFSLILGLALQDTLGNLFAGISLQLDHTFEIGDWLEVANGSQKIIGQVQEITWRAVFLTGLHDEDIIVPNRLMAQSQVSNWNPDEKPILRTNVYKLKPGFDLLSLETQIKNSLLQIEGISLKYSPQVLLSEIDNYFYSLKVAYFVVDYGKQSQILDKVNRKVVELLLENKVELAHPKFEILSGSNS